MEHAHPFSFGSKSDEFEDLKQIDSEAFSTVQSTIKLHTDIINWKRTCEEIARMIKMIKKGELALTNSISSQIMEKLKVEKQLQSGEMLGLLPKFEEVLGKSFSELKAPLEKTKLLGCFKQEFGSGDLSELLSYKTEEEFEKHKNLFKTLLEKFKDRVNTLQ